MKQGAVSGVLSRSQLSRRRHAALGVSVVAALTLSACTSAPPDPQPWPSPTIASATAPASPSPTPSPTAEAVTPPERPAEMDRADDVGAAAAAEYFLQLFAYVNRTGDLTEWDTISAQDCDFCNATRERVHSLYSQAGYFTRGEVALGTADYLGYDEEIRVHAAGVPFSFSEGTRVDHTGAAPAHLGSEEGYAIVDVVYTSQGWTLLGASLGEEPPR